MLEAPLMPHDADLEKINQKPKQKIGVRFWKNDFCLDFHETV